MGLSAERDKNPVCVRYDPRLDRLIVYEGADAVDSVVEDLDGGFFAFGGNAKIGRSYALYFDAMVFEVEGGRAEQARGP